MGSDSTTSSRGLRVDEERALHAGRRSTTEEAEEGTPESLLQRRRLASSSYHRNGKRMRRGKDVIILPSHRQSRQLVLIHEGVSLPSPLQRRGGDPGEPGSRL